MRRSLTRLHLMARKRLHFQTLEKRDLLAGDLCDDMIVDSQDSDTTAATFTTAGSFQAADAGSTRGSAFDLGSIDGSRRIPGRLGGSDRIDMIRFNVPGDADVRLSLSQLNRNADLYLIDDRGSILARSNQRGRSGELITRSLEAGDYYAAVVARSFRQIRYQLELSAELENTAPVPTPPPTPTPDPIPAPSAPMPPVTSPPTSAPSPSTGGTPAGNTPAPNGPSSTNPSPAGPSNVQPLSDVAYFGGGREWNVNAVGAPEAWAAGYTGQGVTVAVIDTGVDLDHPDLVGSLFVNPGEIAGNGIDDDQNGYVDDVHGYDFAQRDSNPDDVNGHGTHVAGTIAAANNGLGATGVAPGAKILPVRVLGDNGSGSDRDVAAGIRYAAQIGADIINLSLGGGYSRAIESAISYARSLGSLIVAAAGNESATTPGYPARFSSNHDHVLSVGAFSSSGRIAGFSNDVGGSTAVQIDAPGAGVYSTYVGGRYATLSGTSMASPHVAGLAALTLSANPNLTSQQLRDLLATGTVGRATGSDAIGKANATTTVAYAAAGLTTAPQNSAGASASTRGLASNSARANGVIVGAPSFHALVESTAGETTESVIVQPTSTVHHDRRLVHSADSTPRHSVNRAVDAIYSQYEDAIDGDEASIESVIEMLV